MADHEITLERPADLGSRNRRYRTVCSCGRYRSAWTFYAGLAEAAGAAHVKAKTIQAVLAKGANR